MYPIYFLVFKKKVEFIWGEWKTCGRICPREWDYFPGPLQAGALRTCTPSPAPHPLTCPLDVTGKWEVGAHIREDTSTRQLQRLPLFDEISEVILF